MMTKEAVMNGLDMYHKRLKDELSANGSIILGKRSSTVEGSMWYTIDEDLFWSLYLCINGSRVEIAYGQLKSRN